jgi:hypothetical protein
MHLALSLEGVSRIPRRVSRNVALVRASILERFGLSPMLLHAATKTPIRRVVFSSQHLLHQQAANPPHSGLCAGLSLVRRPRSSELVFTLHDFLSMRLKLFL